MPRAKPHTFSPILLGSLPTTTPSPCLPCLSPDQHELFKGHASYPVPVADWVVQLCGREWEMAAHSVLWARQWELTCWLAFSSCFPYNLQFGKPIALLTVCFTLVSCLAYSLTLKVDKTCSLRRWSHFNELCILLSQKTELFCEHDTYILETLYPAKKGSLRAQLQLRKQAKWIFVHSGLKTNLRYANTLQKLK
jgi:hypothetical protein